MSDGILCINCGYLESQHEDGHSKWYQDVRPGYEISAYYCTGYEDE